MSYSTRSNTTHKRVAGLIAVAAAIPAVALSAVPAVAAGGGSAFPSTLAAAQAQWPGAQVSPDGTMSHPGRYIVQLADGHYTLIGMGVGARQTAAAKPIAASPLSCYYIKQEVYTYEFIGVGYITFDTWNHTNNSCGNQAWGDTETPGCSAFPGCGPILGMGWIGQGSYTVNAWLNQQPVPVIGAVAWLLLRGRHHLPAV
jgi:hypothetical protein